MTAKEGFVYSFTGVRCNLVFTTHYSPLDYDISLSNPSMPTKNNTHPKGWVLFMAEKEGFEPSIPFWGIHDFQSCALGQLRDFSKLCQLLTTCL